MSDEVVSRFKWQAVAINANGSDWLDMDAKRTMALHTYDCTM